MQKLIGKSVFRALRPDIKRDVCSRSSEKKICNYASVANCGRKGSHLLSWMPHGHTKNSNGNARPPQDQLNAKSKVMDWINSIPTDIITPPVF